MNQNKKIFKLGEIFLYMVFVYLVIYIFTYFRMKWKSPFSLLISLCTGIYFPVFFLLIRFFYPIFIEKLNLTQHEKIIFEGMYRYIIWWIPAIWIFNLLWLDKGLLYYIFSSLSECFLIFCLETIIAFFRIRRIKQ